METQEMASSRNPLWVLLGLSFLFFVVFLGVSAYLFMGRESASETTTKGSGAFFGSSKAGVGILEVKGILMDSKQILKRLDDLSSSDSVKAIVLRIDSPGGAVAPSQEIYEALRKEKKPVVASMSSLAASGGYYIACGAKKIFANPGTLTGSIGVRMDFMNLKDLYQWAKIKRYVVKAGQYKDSGAEYRDMTPEERKLFQDMIDDVHMQFKQTVASARKLSLKKVEEVADGRILSGAQAFRMKLVDELGTLDDAVKDAAKTAGIEGEPVLIYPEKPRPKFLEWVMDQGEAGEDAGAFFSKTGLRGVFEKLRQGQGIPQVLWLWNGAVDI